MFDIIIKVNIIVSSFLPPTVTNGNRTIWYEFIVLYSALTRHVQHSMRPISLLENLFLIPVFLDYSPSPLFWNCVMKQFHRIYRYNDPKCPIATKGKNRWNIIISIILGRERHTAKDTKIGEEVLSSSSTVEKTHQSHHCDHPLILKLNESIEHRMALNEKSWLLSLFFVLDERMMNDVYWIRSLL